MTSFGSINMIKWDVTFLPSPKSLACITLSKELDCVGSLSRATLMHGSSLLLASH